MSPMSSEAAAHRLRHNRRGTIGTPTPGVPEAMAILRAYVLDATSGITTFPPRPTDVEGFKAALTDLEAGIPNHKWGKLDRMRDVIIHYDLPIEVKSHRAYPKIGHQ